jgi:hypothetical protein
VPEHDPEPRRDAASDDAAWRDLVRRLEESESGAPEQQAAGTAGLDAAPAPAAAGPERETPGPRYAAPGPRDYVPEEEDDEGFVPEDPPVLGSGNPLTVLAWCGAAGAPLALLLLAIVWRGAPSVAWAGLCLVFIASVGYLLWRLPGQRSEGDDGSRV